MTYKLSEKKYDLEERTAKFGENIINFCKKIPRSPINDPLITQLTKAGTSVGANYSEADDAESKNDFRHKIGICKKESRVRQLTDYPYDCCCSSEIKRRSKTIVGRS